MPIGKNAIKRVTNNGYSNVKTSAPDMENRVVSVIIIANTTNALLKNFFNISYLLKKL